VALRSLVEVSEDARKAALAAGGAAQLSKAMLRGAADTKLALALALASLVQDDWESVQASTGWGGLITALASAAAAATPQMKSLADAAVKPLLVAVGDELLQPPARGHPSLGGLGQAPALGDTAEGTGSETVGSTGAPSGAAGTRAARQPAPPLSAPSIQRAQWSFDHEDPASGRAKTATSSLISGGYELD